MTREGGVDSGTSWRDGMIQMEGIVTYNIGRGGALEGQVGSRA